MIDFIRSERGSSIIGWVIIVPTLFFFAAFGFVYFYSNQARACVAMAAREGAREYGIQLGQVGATTAEIKAKNRALKVMVQEKMFSQDKAKFSSTPPPAGERGASATFSDSGTWAKCTITYYLPNPLPTAPRLLWKKDDGDEGGWWPVHFKVVVTGAAKHEYKQENP